MAIDRRPSTPQGGGAWRPMLMVHALASVVPQAVSLGMGPSTHDFSVTSSSHAQWSVPMQSVLPLHEELQVLLPGSQVPPHGHWVSA